MLLARAWEQDPSLATCDLETGEVITVHRPLEEDQIQELESAYKVSFPIEYRAFLKRVGDISIGPGLKFNRPSEGLSENSHRPFPLKKPLLGRCSPDHHELPKDQQWDDYGRLVKHWDAIAHDFGVQSIADYGCAMYALLILNGHLAGRVWMLSGDAAYYGPFGGSEMLHDGASVEWEPTFEPTDYSFLEWYLHWLNSKPEDGLK